MPKDLLQKIYCQHYVKANKFVCWLAMDDHAPVKTGLK